MVNLTNSTSYILLSSPPVPTSLGAVGNWGFLGGEAIYEQYMDFQKPRENSLKSRKFPKNSNQKPIVTGGLRPRAPPSILNYRNLS